MAASLPPNRSAHSTPLPAGGAPSPPHDPPAASGTPLRGQEETNAESQPQPSAAVLQPNDAASKTHALSSAFEFGWQSRLQYGRTSANKNVTFESIEAELEKRWRHLQTANKQDLPWQAARETAKDAWNQVYDALTDSERKQ